ncbi:hypothetical protein Dsin_019659 [Dipteronia sinensis]|uniref:Late embryogenesis abundant protein LEA-2 subgroup domain-containing protein n=1 Tax=Dipteronia sinensis TaxID=43782 RepID=A0AAE0A903_9ROSI|nr:hypothetical protein Dsin_019659 [Dipteronia sinensis]
MSHPQSSQPVRRFIFIRRLILVLIFLFAVFAILNWTVWLILNPQPPVFTVNSLSVSNFTSNSQQILKANYNLQLSINNPNKKITLFVDDFLVFVFYKDTNHVLKSTSMNLTLPVCLEKTSGQSLSLLGDMVESSVWSRRSMVKVQMMVTIRFRAANLLTREKNMEVSCNDLGSGFIKGRGKDCSLHFV